MMIARGIEAFKVNIRDGRERRERPSLRDLFSVFNLFESKIVFNDGCVTPDAKEVSITSDANHIGANVFFAGGTPVEKFSLSFNRFFVHLGTWPG